VQAHPRCELIVMEHGSSDGSVEILQRLGIDAVTHPLRGGTIAYARNVGARMARGNILAFLDCDVDVPPDYMTRLEAGFAETGADSLGFPVALPDDPTWVERNWHELTIDARRGERHFLNSANVSFTREAFDRVGGFPEELETGEDWEISRRLKAGGGRIFADPVLIAKHLDNPKSIAAFFRKERWYGKGMLGASERNSLNLTTVATIAFGFLLLTAGVGAVLRKPWLVGIPALAIAALVMATYAFRRRSTGHWAPPTVLVLILVFYAARLSGLAASLAAPRPPLRSGRS